MTVLKRGNELDLDELFVLFEDHFANPEKPLAARPSSSSAPSGSKNRVWQPALPPTIPEDWPPVSSQSSEPANSELASGSEYELVEGDAPPRPSSSALSTMSDADHEWMVAHELSNSGPWTGPEHLLTGMGAPLSSPVYPTWFHPNHGLGLMGANHAPQPNFGSNPRPSTEFDSDHRLVVEEPPSRTASPTEFDADHASQVVNSPPPSPGSASTTESENEMQYDTAPSSPVSLTDSDYRSMGADLRLEGFQAVSDELKRNVKEPRHIFGATRYVLNAA